MRYGTEYIPGAAERLLYVASEMHLQAIGVDSEKACVCRDDPDPNRASCAACRLSGLLPQAKGVLQTYIDAFDEDHEMWWLSDSDAPNKGYCREDPYPGSGYWWALGGEEDWNAWMRIMAI